MRIIYPVSIFPTITETFILDQITALLDVGHDVRIIAFQTNVNTLVHPQVLAYDLMARTTCVKRYEEGSDFDFTPELDDILKGADVIHAHFAAFPTEFAFSASQRFCIPFVFTTHAYDIFVHSSAARLTEYAAAASRIITVTEFNKRFMLDAIGGQNKDKITIIRCGVNVELFSPVKRPVRKPVTIVTTGRLVEKKGITYAVRAMALLPKECQAVLRVIGSGPLELQIRQTIDELHLQERVTLLGGLARTDIIREMQSADIFILPSVTAANNDREGLPVAILEAQAMQLPVVSTLHTGIPEGVVNGVTGILVPERDSEALAGALSRLIGDPELRRRMGERGRQHIEENFNIFLEMEKLKTVLQEAVHSGKSRVSEDSVGQLVKTGRLLRKTRVLVVSHSSFFDGAEQSLLLFLQHMDRSRYEPVVVLPAALPEGRDTLCRKLEEAGIKILFLPSPWWINDGADEVLLRDFLIECATAQLLAEVILQERADLVYSNTIVKISGALAARLAGVPHVYHVREILKDHPLRPPVSLCAAFRLVNVFSDKIIANSKAVAQQFVSLSNCEKVRVVYNAVDVSMLDAVANKGKLRTELGVSEETGLVAIIGTVHTHKNHEDLVRAFAAIRQKGVEARLLIIGNADSDYGDRVRALVEERGIGDVVHFLPFRNDIPEILVDLDVVVVASLAEPFGRTTIEAMAAGKPVVATDAGGSPEVVVDGVTGFLVPLHDTNAMAESLAALLTNPELASSMGAEGRKRVEDCFGLESYVAGIESIFAGLAQGSGFHRRVAGHQVAQDIMKALGPDEFHHLALSIAERFDQLGRYAYNFLAPAMAELQKMNDDAMAELQKKDEEARVELRKRNEEEKRLRSIIDQKTAEISQLEARYSILLNSRSWRITAPMRKIKSLLSKN